MTFNKYKQLINSRTKLTVDENTLKAAYYFVKGAEQWIKSPVLVLSLPQLQQALQQDLWIEGVTVELFDAWAQEVSTMAEAKLWSEAFYLSLSFPTKWDKDEFLKVRNEQ
ncbi:MAG: hypothetical protein EOM67_13880 [Spirochaetia bacterium]|nr:hypothetical protein [Spirochaetia bacterium]